MTPTSSSAEISRASIALYVRGRDLDPISVTKAINQMPTHAHKRGDARKTSSGQEIVAKDGMWALVRDASLNEIAEEIASVTSLLGGGVNLRDLPDVDRAYLDVFVALPERSALESPEMTFAMTNAVLLNLSAAGIEVQFTVCVAD